PARTAAVAGADRMTYAELDERSTRAAHVLESHGVGPRDHVACCLGNTIAHLVAMLACYKLRAGPLNVNTRYVEDELAYVARDSDAVGFVCDAESRARVAGAASQAGVRFTLDVGGPTFTTDVADASPLRDFGPRSPDDRYILYTGGTTGMPKG